MPQFDDPETFRSILESLQIGVYLVDRNQKILFWNDGAERITGYLRQDVVGRFGRENLLAHADDSTGESADVDAAFDSMLRDGRPAVAEVSLRHKSGHRIPVRLRAVPLRDRDGAIIGAAESFDETMSAADWDRRQSKLAGYGCLDQSTGALNHAFTQSHLRESLATFVEHRIPFSIVCVQADKMDDFRAAYGPGAITAIVRAIAQTLETSLRPTDFLGRFSENQFLAILTECSSTEIGRVVERLKKMVTLSEIKWWGDALSVTASFGGTTVKPGDTTDSILERAQKSLRQSVATGGNCITVLAQ
jgi:diguanylate cyclase (GGDEF)-like protein/PAS domain S-box-containing protein